MKLRVSSSRTAGLTAAAVSAAPTAMWAIVLFAGTPPGVSKFDDALGFVRYAFSPENSMRINFVFLAALPVCLLALSLIYLGATTLTKSFALALLVSNLVLVALSVRYGPSDLAFVVMLPAWWGWKCVREAHILEHDQ